MVRTKGFGKHYDTVGVEQYYESFEHDLNKKYTNPHSKKFSHIIKLLLTHTELECNPILDLSCGSGEITKELQLATTNQIIGCDPYLYERYEKNTGNKCFRYNFDDIISGDATDLPNKFSIVFCSYALHLCNNINELLKYFSTKAKYFCILSPNGHQFNNLYGTGYVVDWIFKYKNIKIYLLKVDKNI